jgi:phosphohistidine phosphatase
MREGGYPPDLVVCSTASRARQTWELVAGELGVAPPVEWDVRVYAATVDELLDVVRDVPDEAATVLLVGHNPGAQDLVLTLVGSGSTEALRQAAVKFPTAAFAVLTVESSWSALSPGGAEMVDFAVPRG